MPGAGKGSPGTLMIPQGRGKTKEDSMKIRIQNGDRSNNPETKPRPGVAPRWGRRAKGCGRVGKWLKSLAELKIPRKIRFCGEFLIKLNPFSAGACTWTKTLLGPQTCEPRPLRGVRCSGPQISFEKAPLFQMNL